MSRDKYDCAMQIRVVRRHKTCFSELFPDVVSPLFGTIVAVNNKSDGLASGNLGFRTDISQNVRESFGLLYGKLKILQTLIPDMSDDVLIVLSFHHKKMLFVGLNHLPYFYVVFSGGGKLLF